MKAKTWSTRTWVLLAVISLGAALAAFANVAYAADTVMGGVASIDSKSAPMLEIDPAGASSITLSAPEREGYVFEGWDVSGSGSLEYLGESGTAGSLARFTFGDGDTRLSAKWAPTPAAVSRLVVRARLDSPHPLIIGEESTGHWVRGADGAALYFDFDASAVLERFVVMGVASDGRVVLDDIPLADLDSISFDCSRWKVGSAGNRVDVTYRGVAGSFEASVVRKQVTLTYDSGVGVVKRAVGAGETVAVESCSAVRSGYEFAGWSMGTAGTSTVIQPHTALVVERDTLLVARWVKTSDEVSPVASWLTVDPAGGTWNGSTSPVRVSGEQGTVMTIANPDRTGFVFAGWDLQGAGKIERGTSIAIVGQPLAPCRFTFGDGDARLSAKWVGLTAAAETERQYGDSADGNASFAASVGGNEVILDTMAGGMATLTEAKGARGSVTIGKAVTANGSSVPVTAIGAGAFAGAGVTSVRIGKNVRSIGARAFKGCKKLKSARLGKNVTTVGSKAFKGCKNLSALVIGSPNLTKDSCKAMLKGSSIKKVRVKIAGMSKTQRSQVVERYRSWLPAKVAGAKLTVS